MMRTGFGLQWEWCLPNLTNCATKMACGIVSDKARSKNVEMTQLIGRIVKTIYQVKHVEVMGFLFATLCELLGDSKSNQLVEFKIHRFMGLTRVVERILDKWEPLAQWFNERTAKALRENKEPPASFPLAEDKTELHQLLSLLQPITILNQRCQAEIANQIEVLLTLYNLRSTTLNCSRPLKDHRSTKDNVLYFALTEMTARHASCSETPFKELLKNVDATFRNIITLCSLQNGDTQTAANRNVAIVQKAIVENLCRFS